MRIRRYKPRHLIPRPNPLAGPAAAGTATALLLASSPAAAATHTVRRGETLSQIATRYGTSVMALARVNRIANPNLIVAGERLRLPGKGARPSGARVHTVRSGETLSGIAARYGMTLRGIVRRNNLPNPNLIVTGQRLTVRAGGRAGGAQAASLPNTSRASIGVMIHRHAVSHGVDPALAKAVAWQESGWQQNVVSSAGAIGVMQVMPGTADYVNQVLGHGNLNVRKTDHNIHLGVAYLRHMLRIMPNERKALAAYYSGPGNVGRRLRSYQRPYVRSVRVLKRRF